jgi:DNA-binding MarR family transcriptional regulator
MSGLSGAESELWISLTMLSQLFAPAMDQRLRPLDLTLFEFGTLMALADAPRRTLRIKVMAERMYSSLPRMSKVVARLEERDLVRRAPAVDDARASDIELTAAGRRKLLSAAAVQKAAAREMVLSLLTAEEVELVGPLLARVARNLDPAGPLGAIGSE